MELDCFLGTSGLFHSLSIKPFKIPVRKLYRSANYKRRQRRVRTTGWWERLAGISQNFGTTSANGGKLASEFLFLHSFCTVSPCPLETDARQLFKDSRWKVDQLNHRPEPVMDLKLSVPHPVPPSSCGVGGSREKRGFQVDKVPHTFKSSAGPSPGKKSGECPRAASLAAVPSVNCPGKETPAERETGPTQGQM